MHISIKMHSSIIFVQKFIIRSMFFNHALENFIILLCHHVPRINIFILLNGVIRALIWWNKYIIMYSFISHNVLLLNMYILIMLRIGSFEFFYITKENTQNVKRKCAMVYGCFIYLLTYSGALLKGSSSFEVNVDSTCIK